MARDYQRRYSRPPGATEILLVRHGSSAGDGSRVDGSRDPGLSDEGLGQAEALADRLAAETVDALYVTPMRRTLETGAPLARLAGLEPVVIDDLREIHLGAREHLGTSSAAEETEVTRRIFAEGRWDVIPGAEPMDGFSSRVGRGLQTVADEVGPDATAVVIVHAGVIAELCRQVTRSEAFAFLQVENGSLTWLVRKASGRWVLRTFNDTAHLRPGVRLSRQRARKPR
jgi:probable phosphoglycerate mutase